MIAGRLDTDRINRELADAGLAEFVRVEHQTFNPNNSATVSVDQLILADGKKVIRKELASSAPVTVAHWAASARPDHWNYWRREAHVYGSGLAKVHSASGLRPPHLLGLDSDGRRVSLLIEYVEGIGGSHLGLDDYMRIARRLGESQGSSETSQRARGAKSWWSHRWIHQYASSRPVESELYCRGEAWEHPVVVEGFGAERHRIRDGYCRMMDELPLWADLLDSLPQTICHHDLWANNVICPLPTDADARTVDNGEDPDDVLIDWGCVGSGAVGEDIGTFVPDGLLNQLQSPDSFRDFDRAVWGGFSAGLEASEWPYPPEMARLAMCASLVKFCWLPALMVRNADHQGPTAYGGVAGPELVEVFRQRAPVLMHMLELLDEARRMTSRLGLGGDPGLGGQFENRGHDRIVRK